MIKLHLVTIIFFLNSVALCGFVESKFNKSVLTHSRKLINEYVFKMRHGTIFTANHKMHAISNYAKKLDSFKLHF